MIEQTLPLVQAFADDCKDAIHQCLAAAHEAESAARESPRPVGSAEALLRELSDGGEEDAALLAAMDAARTQDLEDDISEAGAIAFKANLPPLTSRRNVQAYIACLAVGLHRHYFTAADAKSALYSAQLALSAWPKRAPSQGRKAKR